MTQPSNSHPPTPGLSLHNKQATVLSCYINGSGVEAPATVRRGMPTGGRAPRSNPSSLTHLRFGPPGAIGADGPSEAAFALRGARQTYFIASPDSVDVGLWGKGPDLIPKEPLWPNECFSVGTFVLSFLFSCVSEGGPCQTKRSIPPAVLVFPESKHIAS